VRSRPQHQTGTRDKHRLRLGARQRPVRKPAARTQVVLNAVLAPHQPECPGPQRTNRDRPLPALRRAAAFLPPRRRACWTTSPRSRRQRSSCCCAPRCGARRRAAVSHGQRARRPNGRRNGRRSGRRSGRAVRRSPDPRGGPRASSAAARKLQTRDAPRYAPRPSNTAAAPARHTCQRRAPCDAEGQRPFHGPGLPHPHV
jgi:hypothetical protein